MLHLSGERFGDRTRAIAKSLIKNKALLLGGAFALGRTIKINTSGSCRKKMGQPCFKDPQHPTISSVEGCPIFSGLAPIPCFEIIRWYRGSLV